MVGEWKQLVNFCEKGSFLVILAAYLLRGLFYRRTNLAISIRYISEKHLQESKNTTSCQDGTKRKISGMGQIDPYQKENPPYIVRMHTAQDHAVNLHGRRLNIPAVRSRERQTTLRYRALSYTVTSIANVATPACPSLLRRKDILGRHP